jgi:DNA-binding transcriptional regulator GbsR (MarR family)
MNGTSIEPHHVPVKEQVIDESEQIRRDFATAWAQISGPWGVAPSTAAVQGYLLLSPGPRTEAEIRKALGLSHRAAFGALAECERWGLTEQAEPQRTGSRGPAGRAIVAVGDPWEWFRRVAASWKSRETDPALPILEDCLKRAGRAGDAGLEAKVQLLVDFARQYEHGLSAVVSSDAATIARLFGVLTRIDDAAIRRMLSVLAEIPEEELATAAVRISSMRPSLLRRLVRLASNPGLARLLDRFG